MIRRPPRSTPLYSSAASDVYKRQHLRQFRHRHRNRKSVRSQRSHREHPSPWWGRRRIWHSNQHSHRMRFGRWSYHCYGHNHRILAAGPAERRRSFRHPKHRLRQDHQPQPSRGSLRHDRASWRDVSGRMAPVLSMHGSGRLYDYAYYQHDQHCRITGTCTRTGRPDRVGWDKLHEPRNNLSLIHI